MKRVVFTIAVLVSLLGFAVEHPWHKEVTYTEDGANAIQTEWKYVPAGWRPRVKPGGHWKGNFYPYSKFLDKWVVVETNAVIHPISVKSRSKFQDKIDEMEPGYQKQKKLEQAARKFGKNLEKKRKNFEKYRDKAATEDERAFWQSLLDSIPVPNETAK